MDSKQLKQFYREKIIEFLDELDDQMVFAQVYTLLRKKMESRGR